MGCLLSTSHDIQLNKPFVHYEHSYLQSLMKTNRFYIPFVYAISNNNRQIAFCKYNTQIYIYNINSKNTKLITASNNVNYLMYTSKNDEIIYGTNNGYVYIKSIESGNTLKTFENNTLNSIVTKIAISQCGLYMGYVLKVSNNDRDCFLQYVFSIESKSLIKRFESTKKIVDLYFTNDSEYIITVSYTHLTLPTTPYV